MHSFEHVLAHVLNEPLLAHPAKAEIVAGVVLRRAGVEIHVESTAIASSLGPLQERSMRERSMRWGEGKPFLFQDGIAGIEIVGSLAHRQWHIGKSSGVMGYDGIGAQLDAALEDGEVQAILLDIHSAGGEVPGAFNLADRIRAANAVKPVVAIADEMAFSAAYLLGAAAGELWLASETAQVGSVGVVAVHFSFAENLAEAGIKPTIIQAGARKAEGNPFQDLPESARSNLQKGVNAVYEIFVDRVAGFRATSAKAVRDTEAGIFMGQEAVTMGLADGIAEPLAILGAMIARARAGALPAPRRA